MLQRLLFATRLPAESLERQSALMRQSDPAVMSDNVLEWLQRRIIAPTDSPPDRTTRSYEAWAARVQLGRISGRISGGQRSPHLRNLAARKH